MIRQASKSDFDTIYEIINDAAIAYKGRIPDDCWHEPYMSTEALIKQMEEGVEFYCYEHEEEVAGVMGMQDKGDVNLIRHAYVRTKHRKHGIGSKLIQFIFEKSNKPVLVGTWRDATWAIDFYFKHGFVLVDQETEMLLRKYWNIPERQLNVSVVLAKPEFIAGLRG